MNTTLAIYIWGLLDSFKVGCQAISAISIFVVGACILVGAITAGEVNFFPHLQNHKKKLIFLFGIGLLSIFIPSSKTFAAMIVVPLIIESKMVQKDMPELYNAAVERLKESLIEIKAEK